MERILLAIYESDNGDGKEIGNTGELAGSIRALHHSVSSVPSDYDYMYGRFQVQQIVTVVPGVGFGSEGYFRFSYATDMDTIKEGVRRIEDFLKKQK